MFWIERLIINLAEELSFRGTQFQTWLGAVSVNRVSLLIKVDVSLLWGAPDGRGTVNKET